MPAGCSHLKEYRRRRGERERDGVREDGEPCVWRRRDGVMEGCKGKDKIDGGGGTKAEVMDSNETK